MALSPREFVEEVNKIYNIIEKRKNSSIKKLGDISINDILEEVFEISAALQRLYIFQKNLDSLSEQETLNVLKKAKFIALMGVFEFFKIYNNKSEYNFWETYSQEAGFTVNDNFIYKILEQSLIDIKILSSKTKENILSIISLQANLSESYIEDIITLLNSYIKYLYPSVEIIDYINDIKLESNSIFFNLLPEELKDTTLACIKRLSKIENKVVNVIQELISFINFCDFSNKILSYNNINLFIDEYANHYESDIYNILINDNLKKLFLSIINGISVNKFSLMLKYLKEKNDDFEILLPNLDKIKVSQFIDSDKILFGNYKFLDYDVNVLPSPYFSLEYLCNLKDNIVNHFGNKIILKSNNPFDINIGNIESDSIPSEIFKDGKSHGFIWLSDKPSINYVNILSEDFETETIVPSEKIIADLTLKLFEDEYTPSFKLLLHNLILISPDNSSKKVEIFNIDSYTTNEINIDKMGLGFLGEALYEINSKKPGIIEFYFLNNNNFLDLKYFEPKISYVLDESILFNTLNKKVLLPNEDIDEKIERLYLFTTKNYDNKWFNDVCEVINYTSFGKYNVYEIIWIDRTKSLEINLDRKHKWKFTEKEHLHFEVITNKYNSDIIKFKDNQVTSIDDIKIIISESQKIKDIYIKISFNFNKVNSYIKIGYINSLIGKDINNNVIDSLFFYNLMKNYNPGRYDIEFYYENKQIYNYTFFIIPKFQVIEESNIYLEGDDIVISLNSDYPCFRNNKTTQSYLFDKKAKCNFEIRQNNIIHSRKVPYFKKVRIYDPFTEFDIIYEPEVIGFRIMKDNKLFLSDKVDFYTIDKKSVLLKNPLKDAKLKVNNQLVKPLYSNNHGIVLENFSTIKNYLNKVENEVVFSTSKVDISFQIIYYPKVTSLYTTDNLYFNNQLSFFISYQGPQNSIIKILVEDTNFNPINVKKVSCDDDLSPRFIKYDKERNSFNIICDGKEYKDRKFNIHLENASENINLKAIYEYNNLEFGNILYLNGELNKEVKYLSRKINDSESGESYFQRGLILLQEGFLEMARKDFKKAIEVGIYNEEMKEHISYFIENLNKKELYCDILHISELLKDFCKKELLLNVE